MIWLERTWGMKRTFFEILFLLLISVAAFFLGSMIGTGCAVGVPLDDGSLFTPL